MHPLSHGEGLLLFHLHWTPVCAATTLMTVPKPIRIGGFLLLHIWIVFHFAAVLIAPASVPPATRLAQQSWSYCGGYLQFLFLNHGYHFFAPDPAGSTLIAYEATMPDGSTEWNRIPNREIWPRLNYHRHFMLTEHMAATVSVRPDMADALAETYANEIARQTGARHVVLYEVNHSLSSPEQVRAGRHLDDPVTYWQELIGEYAYDNQGNLIEPSAPVPTTAPSPSELDEVVASND